MSPILLRAALRLLPLTFVVACAPARMALPTDLGPADRMEVRGGQGWRLNQQITFGPYRTDPVDRSWTRSRDLQVLVYDGTRRRQTYGFALSESGRPRWVVACATLVRQDYLSLDGWALALRDNGRLLCDIDAVDRDERTLRLTLVRDGDHPLRGTLEGDGLHVTVEGTRRLEKALPLDETTGYHLRSGSRILGAVQVMDAGAVWLAADLEDHTRSALAALAAALLALEEVR